MLHHLDLILLACLHGSFVSCVMLLSVFVILNALLLAFFLGLLFVVVLDMYDALSFLSQDVVVLSLKENVTLGFISLLAVLTELAIHVSLASKPLLLRKLSEVKVNAQRVAYRIDAMVLAMARAS